MWDLPNPRTFTSLIDLIEDAATRYAGREQYVLRTDDGPHLQWTAGDVVHHSKLVAWRLRGLGIKPGDRILTWSPSTPALPAVYFGAARAGAVIVPLDLRMAPDVLVRIAQSAGAQWLAIGTGFVVRGELQFRMRIGQRRNDVRYRQSPQYGFGPADVIHVAMRQDERVQLRDDRVTLARQIHLGTLGDEVLDRGVKRR